MMAATRGCKHAQMSAGFAAHEPKPAHFLCSDVSSIPSLYTGGASAPDGGPSMSKRESLYHKYPDYRVDLEANPNRVQVRFENQVVADSERALLVKESNHEAVV